MRANISLDVPSQHQGRRCPGCSLGFNTAPDPCFPYNYPMGNPTQVKDGSDPCHPKGFLPPLGGFSGYKVSSKSI